MAFDAYVLQLNRQTRKLIYATRIGGSNYNKAARIKVDRKGFAYLIDNDEIARLPDNGRCGAAAVWWRR